MPQVFKIGGYVIYFWLDEGKPLEPVHVHVAEGVPQENATKIVFVREFLEYRGGSATHGIAEIYDIAKVDSKGEDINDDKHPSAHTMISFIVFLMVW